MRFLLHPFMWVAYAIVVTLAVLVAVGQGRESGTARSIGAPIAVVASPTVPVAVAPAAGSPVAETSLGPSPTGVLDDVHLPEVLLATIQYGEELPAADPRVRAFASLLDTLEGRCTEDRLRLADIIADANELLERRGRREPILDTFRDFVDSTDGVTSDFPCDTLVDSYVEDRLRDAPSQ